MYKTVATAALVAALAGCGGGGGESTTTTGSGTVSTPIPAITYFQQGGLKWSSTSPKTYYYAPLGSSLDLTGSNGFYCNGSINGVLSNFNNETGWRLPTLVELQALYKENHTPPGFVQDKVWTSSTFALDFATGTLYTSSTVVANYYVTCVHAL